MMANQWMWHAMKKWEDAHDLELKNKVARVLHKRLNYPSFFDRTIFIKRNDYLTWTDLHPTGYKSKEALLRDWWVQNPDVLVKRHGLIVEIDGDWHFNSPKGIKLTNARNEHYDIAGLRLVWLTTKECDCSLEELYCKIMGQLNKPRSYSLP